MYIRGYTFFLVGLLFFLQACSDKSTRNSYAPANTKEFGDYWYQGEAELNTYTLQQARYGEIREGHAVMIFVTEPFSVDANTKADDPSEDDPTVMKLNFTRKFLTGIYPYSTMTSTFFPVNGYDHAIKISTSIQEWCGHVYMELNYDSNFKYVIHSYFEGENEKGSLVPEVMEDELITQIRINPESLPVGQHSVCPPLTFLRFKHIELKAYPCEITKRVEDDVTVYTLNYEEIDRTAVYYFQTEFPHKILEWSETYESGFGEAAKLMTTSGKLDQSIKVDYWNKNAVADSVWRSKLEIRP